MATDPFNSLRIRLSNTVTRRGSLGVLGLFSMANLALPDEATARKKRKRKKKNKKKAGKTTTPAPTTTGTTTRAPGTCGAAGSICGTEQTPCICAYNVTDLEQVRCVSLVGFDPLDECIDDSECTDGKVCGMDQYQQNPICISLCEL